MKKVYWQLKQKKQEEKKKNDLINFVANQFKVLKKKNLQLPITLYNL